MFDIQPILALAPDKIRMLAQSVMQESGIPLSRLKAEQPLNAIARTLSGVPTGGPAKDRIYRYRYTTTAVMTARKGGGNL